MSTIGELIDRLEQLRASCGRDTPVYYYISGSEYPLDDIMQVSFCGAEPADTGAPGEPDLPDRVLIN